MVSDTVTVELHNSSSPYGLVDQAKVVLSSSGSANANFFSASDGTNYYIVVKHRNSIETWSKTSQSFSGGVLSYDFTTAANKAYGDNMKLKGTKWCIYSGDINQDGVVNPIDLTTTGDDTYNFAAGYLSTDLNGDNIVDLNDLIICDNNVFGFVTKATP